MIEPFAENQPARFARSGAQLVTLDEALTATQIVILAVDHTAFKHLAPDDLAVELVFDTRGMLRR